MIPHNIQQKLEEKLEHLPAPKTGVECALEEKAYQQGAEDLWNILTEGAMEFDLNECLAGRELGDRRLPFTEGARWQFNILKPKMMAMEAEIQRLRGTLRKVEPGPLTEEELKWIEEDERG